MKAAAFVAAFIFLIVLLLRWLPPPFSMIMIQRKVEAKIADRKDFRLQFQWTSYGKIAPAMSLAVIAAEDQKFQEHCGFDWMMIRDALRKNHKQRHKFRHGASTITQQTAKNIFLWPSRSYLCKGMETVLTFLMELLWPKKRILEMYLNIVELGDGLFGVGAASQSYFHKPAEELTTEEAALLAAMLPNPRQFSAVEPSDTLLQRQWWVLEQMRTLKFYYAKNYTDQ